MQIYATRINNRMLEQITEDTAGQYNIISEDIGSNVYRITLTIPRHISAQVIRVIADGGGNTLEV